MQVCNAHLLEVIVDVDLDRKRSGKSAEAVCASHIFFCHYFLNQHRHISLHFGWCLGKKSQSHIAGVMIYLVLSYISIANVDLYSGVAAKAAVSQTHVFQTDFAQICPQRSTSRKEGAREENEPDPAGGDELEESPSLQKRARSRVADGAPLKTTNKLTLRTRSQKRVPYRIRKRHTTQPLKRMRLKRMTYLILQFL